MSGFAEVSRECQCGGSGFVPGHPRSEPCPFHADATSAARARLVRAALVRQVDAFAAQEAELSAARRANDAGAQELAAWLRRQRQAAELRLQSLEAPPRTDQPSLF